MKIYDLLKEDHKKIKDLLSSIEKNKDLSKFEELKKEVISHSEAEEEAFYEPLQDKAGKLKIMVKIGHEEHDLTMKMLKQLDKIDDDEQWMQLFLVVKKSLEAHIKMEEQDIFHLSKQHFSNEESEEMAASMQAKKDKWLKKYNK